MDRAVEVTHTAKGITLLFDTFSGESRNLLESFKNAGAPFMRQSLRMTVSCRMM